VLIVYWRERPTPVRQGVGRTRRAMARHQAAPMSRDKTVRSARNSSILNVELSGRTSAERRQLPK
jgi:hypothetical protein